MTPRGPLPQKAPAGAASACARGLPSPYAYRELWLVLAVSALGVALVVVLGLRGWSGAPNDVVVDGVDTYFCETLRDGPIKQPANTWSCLAFTAAGLLIAWRTGRRRARREPTPPALMARAPLYAGLYAAQVALIGPASMLLHASMTAWGGACDMSSMFLYTAFLGSFLIVRWRGLGGVGFACAYAFLGGATFTVYALWPLEGLRLFGTVAALAALGEGAFSWSRRPRTDVRWLGLALGCFALALAVWWLSLTGHPLCAPDSLLQGHALWHVLCALTTLALFEHYAREQDLGAPS